LYRHGAARWIPNATGKVIQTDPLAMAKLVAMSKSKVQHPRVESAPHYHLSRHDKQRSATLQQVNGLAWLLDNSIHIPILNYRIGLDAIVGLIPGFGDIAGSLLSSFIVLQAIRLGMPLGTLVRMVLNIAIEASIGVIPVVGDLFDATFKANARNVGLLNQVLGNSADGLTTGKRVPSGVIALVILALVGIVVLVGGAGVMVFWWVASLI
jgi:hypothetical protein